MKFGLFGTGPWATDVQGPALAAHPDADLVGVWGRDPAKVEQLAVTLGASAYPDVDELLAVVDAVAVALPPYVQAPIALRAARAGRHLLLDKPVALDLAQADALVAEVAERGLASLVFFTSRYQPEIEQFLGTGGDWYGGRSVLHGSIFRTGSPFGASAWRRERGGLWDIGPHALSLLLPTLGGVDRVSAMVGPYDTSYVLLSHTGGAVSTMSLTLDAPPAGRVWETVLYSPDGAVAVPGGSLAPVDAFGRAIGTLVGLATGEAGASATASTTASTTASATAPSHPCDVRLGRDVVAVLAAADAARTTGTVQPVPTA